MLKVSWLEKVWLYLRAEVLFKNVIIIVVVLCLCVYTVYVWAHVCVYMCGHIYEYVYMMCVCVGVYVCVGTCTDMRGQHYQCGSLLPFSHVFGDHTQVTRLCSRCFFPLSPSGPGL